jgi:predicted restriction endonuclease
VTLSNDTREFVRRRANDVCEYCGLPQYASVLAHQIDHIIGRQHHGTDDLENLCLCCIRCNLKKGSNIASIDPNSRLVSALYHPRRHPWRDHFAVMEGKIVGLTSEGRTTVELLDMNDEERVQLRVLLLRRGWRR